MKRPPGHIGSVQLAQCVGLYFILGFFSVQWLAPYLTYTWLIDNESRYRPGDPRGAEAACWSSIRPCSWSPLP